MRKVLGWAAAAGVLCVGAAAVGMGGCGSEPSGAVSDAVSETGSGDGAGDGGATTEDQGGGDAGGGTWAVATEGDAWRVVFDYRGRVIGSETYGQNELWLMDAHGADKQKVTDLAGLPYMDPPLSCNYGCFISEDMTWLAIAEGPADQDGFDFRIGKFTNGTGEFKLIKGLSLQDNVDFKFAGDRLYLSQRSTCVGPSCQYTVSYIDLNTNERHEILTFPLADDLEQSTYKGHFKVSPDGRELILLNTTIRSVGVFLWKDGTGLVKLDFLCKFGTEGNCEGTGSEYDDKDPVAISHDGTRAVFFTFSDRWQRARVYDLTNPGDVEMAVLASVPSGSYIEHACDYGVLEGWQWPRVVGDPVFTPDDQELVFLTVNDCPAPNGVKPKKPKTDLIRVKLATLETGKTLEERDVFNVTRNPGGDVARNIVIGGFRLSPDGATAVFAGTPIYNQSGEPLQDSESRHRNDREILRVRLDGQNLEQLTNSLSWEAQSPRLVPGAAP